MVWHSGFQKYNKDGKRGYLKEKKWGSTSVLKAECIKSRFQSCLVIFQKIKMKNSLSRFRLSLNTKIHGVMGMNEFHENYTGVLEI